MINKINAMIWGGTATWLAYNSLNLLLEYVNQKATIIQTELAKAPELTDQIYQNAIESAERVSKGDNIIGILCAISAGITGAYAIYNACKKDKNSKGNLEEII